MSASDPSAVRPARTPRWLFATVFGVFGLLFAYAVWNAIGNLVAAVQVTAENGRGLNALGWVIWILAAVLPIVVFAAAFRLARDRVLWQVLLIALTGLALVAVFWLDVVAYTQLNTASLLA